jgi:hypothetical protein
MNKQQGYRPALSQLIGTFSTTEGMEALTAYLVAHSNLPGPRGNLELAHSFADAVAEGAGQEAQGRWALCLELAAIPPDRAPVNDSREFLPFCGTEGLGALGAALPRYASPALRELRRLANDPRWRMREGVCFALQRLIAARPQLALAALLSWTEDGSWLELRAVAAGVAEPALLRDRAVALLALDLHQLILARVLESGERRTEPFKVLRKGLAYTLSVVVQALPEEGFAWLARLVETGDADVLWIVRQNLAKNRLRKGFPIQVEALAARLADSQGPKA